MKRLIFPLVVLFILSSCENEPLESEITGFETELDMGKKNENKVTVCHKNGIEIIIAEAALDAHLAHGDAIDRDGDGYYDRENPCSEVDCDDTDAAINPSAPEVCDGIDNNCDGLTDPPVPGVYTVVMFDSYGDGWQSEQGILVTIDDTAISVTMQSSYSGGPPCCDWNTTTEYVEVPVGTEILRWQYTGDSYPGEVSFRIYGPDSAGTPLLGSFGPPPTVGLLPVYLCLE
ncbi:MAG: hypothetical protein HKM99_07310 [Flavobacteriaceae bacterium]|nr:hypothetical protein [Flavobacteriaceae bacterium]